MIQTSRSSIVSYATNRTARASRPLMRAHSVLVVDDEELVRRFVERALRQANYEVSVAVDGAEAIRIAAEQGPFDLLLTDLMMPRLAGDELARRLRKEDPDLKVLYLTGFSDNLFTERVILWEDEAFLDKPCSVRTLLQAVSLLLLGRIEVPMELGC